MIICDGMKLLKVKRWNCRKLTQRVCEVRGITRQDIDYRDEYAGRKSADVSDIVIVPAIGIVDSIRSGKRASSSEMKKRRELVPFF